MADDNDFKWAIPIMRLGYSGRALVYVIVAGISLWSIWHGQNAQGTESAMASLQDGAFGITLLLLVFLGMLAYAVWRLIDSFYDLEDYGTDGEGLIARIGMVVTGLIHLALGTVALRLVFGSGGGEGGESGGGGQSGVAKAVATVMEWPGGRWIVAAAGLATLGAAIYYIHKAWKREYQEKLIANHFTQNWDPALRGGVASQGFVVGVIGALILYAAITFNPDQAGGVGAAFDWLREQPYGRILVGLLCVGLLGFALFCAVNAAYRIIEKVEGSDDLQTLKTKFKQATS